MALRRREQLRCSTTQHGKELNEVQRAEMRVRGDAIFMTHMPTWVTEPLAAQAGPPLADERKRAILAELFRLRKFSDLTID